MSGKSNASSCESKLFRNESDFSSNDDEMFIPEVPDEMKPKEKDFYNSLKDGVEFYLQYAIEVGFGASMSTIKHCKGEISLRYVICTNQENIIKEDGCPAVITFKRVVLVHCNFRLGAYNICVTRAYTLLSSIKGGYNVSGGTVTDFKNFKMDLNVLDGKSDAQMLIDRMKDRVQYINVMLLVSFGLMRHQEETKKNLEIFYLLMPPIVPTSNILIIILYCMVFVPFTRIDNHRRCVTFGVELLTNEPTESYIWLLKIFVKAFGSWPCMIVTDQDVEMKNAINIVISQSRHRLCMWHINKKLFDKVSKPITIIGMYLTR
uniref:MULE transposase domain-containing protein n=1 Tax=Lactuca sativa TaxID=4236 RepID=A0A9R1VNQ6_LACSA|nr:hypothetical protein LSAT_V11C400198450 [Lactuca sativa]